jgi:hypothetical protein
VADAPDFLASALAEYARSEHLDDTGLAGRLGCSLETLTHLRLCRMPREEAPLFWKDIEEIAQRFSLEAELLAEVVRRGQSLFHLRNDAPDQKQASGFLMAARDDARPQKPPEEAEP